MPETQTLERKTTENSSGAGKKEEEELVIGVDIGTQNTAAVMKRGEQTDTLSFSSVIGFPKNDLSRQKLEDLLGRPLAFDREVYESAVMHNIDLSWPLKTFDETFQNEQIDRAELTDRDKETLCIVVERVLTADKVMKHLEGGVDGLQLAFATPSTTAFKFNQNLIDYARRNLPSNTRPSFLVESESHFAGYRLSRIDDEIAREGVVVVDLGAGTKDFHVYTGNPSNDRNTLSFAGSGNEVTNRLYNALKAEGFQNTWQEVEQLKREYGRVSTSLDSSQSEDELIVEELRFQGRENVRADIGAEMEKAHRPLLEEIVDGYKQLMKQYDSGPVPDNVVLVGMQGQTPGLKTAFEKALKHEKYEVRVRNLKDFENVNPMKFTAEGALHRIENTPLRNLAL